MLKLSKNLEKLGRNRHAAELELVNRLPKRRKTSAELSEMAKSKVWKLDKAVERLREMDSDNNDSNDGRCEFGCLVPSEFVLAL